METYSLIQRITTSTTIDAASPAGVLQAHVLSVIRHVMTMTPVSWPPTTMCVVAWRFVTDIEAIGWAEDRGRCVMVP